MRITLFRNHSSPVATTIHKLQQGNVKALFTDLDGTLVDSQLRIEALAKTFLSLLPPNAGPLLDESTVERDFRAAAQAGGSFAASKIWDRLASQDDESRTGVGVKKFPLLKSKFENEAIESVISLYASLTSDHHKNKEKIENLLAEGAAELLQTCRQQNIPIVAVTNAENSKIARLTAALVEAAANNKFTDIIYSNMNVVRDELSKTALGQTILASHTAPEDSAAGCIKLNGKPSADMLMFAAHRTLLNSEKEEVTARKQSLSHRLRHRPNILFIGDQAADREASENMAVLLKKQKFNGEILFAMITGTDSTPKESQARKECLKNIATFRTPLPLARKILKRQKSKRCKPQSYALGT